MDIKFWTRVGEIFETNCESYKETQISCSACDAGYYFDALQQKCTQCENNCFFCEPEKKFDKLKEFLLKQHSLVFANFANEIYNIDWKKEELVTQDISQTESGNTEDTTNSVEGAATPEAIVVRTKGNLNSSAKKLSKIISSAENSKIKDLELVKLVLLDNLFRFNQVDDKKCHLCMKGYTQLDSQVCIKTDVYQYSLGLSLF